MKSKFLITLLLFTILNLNNILGQSSPIDSVIYKKNLSFKPGIVPTYYSAECENRALQIQSTLSEIIKMYSDDSLDISNLKLAVLDSLDWSGLDSPYGFFTLTRNWVIIPGDLNNNSASRIKEFKPVLEKNLLKVSKNLDDALSALYKFCAAHEVGHYYTLRVRLAYPPDQWTMELLANYFAYDYLYKTDKDALQIVNIISDTFIQEYVPKYRTISSFNIGYARVGRENYSWYQSMLFKMAAEIHSVYKFEFLESFTKVFEDLYKLNPKNLIPDEEVTKNMDNLTDGIYSKWLKIIQRQRTYINI